MKRQAKKDCPPVLILQESLDDKRLKGKYTYRYNYLHDKVIKKLDTVMKHYPLGDFEDYKSAWKTSGVPLASRPSKFKNILNIANFSTDRYDDFAKFLFRVIDHIRQSINMLKNYQDASDLREHYERLIEDPYRLMRYYRRRFKTPKPERFLDASAQLTVMPEFDARLTTYINLNRNRPNESIRPMTLLNNNASYSEVVKYVLREAYTLGIPYEKPYTILPDSLDDELRLYSQS